MLCTQVEDTNPPFPRPTAHWWYGCQDAPAAFDASGNVIDMVHPAGGGGGGDEGESGHEVSDIVFDAGKWRC